MGLETESHRRGRKVKKIIRVRLNALLDLVFLWDLLAIRI